MSKYPLPKYPLPDYSPPGSVLPDPSSPNPLSPGHAPSSPASADQAPPKSVRHPTDGGPGGQVPLPRASTSAAHVLQEALKGVYSMFKRLRSSYLRSNAVRDARLDAALTGDQGYLLLHYFHSVK